MSWDVFRRSLNIALENRIPTLNFFGGEPLLNPQVIPMLKTTIENNLSIILATNCRPLSEEDLFENFLNITRYHKENIVIVTARDKFHLKFYDPLKIIKQLRREGYNVVVNDYSNNNILLSEFNCNKRELRRENTSFSCCGGKWTDHVGVLPNGEWTICPPSLVPFGDVFSASVEELIEFKSRLPMRYQKGCSVCLNDFQEFRKLFEAEKAATDLKTS